MEIYNDWFAKSALRHFAAGLGFHDSILLGLGLVINIVELQRAIFVRLKVGFDQQFTIFAISQAATCNSHAVEY